MSHANQKERNIYLSFVARNRGMNAERNVMSHTTRCVSRDEDPLIGDIRVKRIMFSLIASRTSPLRIIECIVAFIEKIAMTKPCGTIVWADNTADTATLFNYDILNSHYLN